MLFKWVVDANAGTLMTAVHEFRMACRETIVREVAAPFYESLHGKKCVRGDMVPNTIQAFTEGIETEIDAIFAKVERCVRVVHARMCIIVLIFCLYEASWVVHRIIAPPLLTYVYLSFRILFFV